MITVKLSSIFSLHYSVLKIETSMNEINSISRDSVFVLTQVVFNECSATKTGSLYFSL